MTRKVPERCRKLETLTSFFTPALLNPVFRVFGVFRGSEIGLPDFYPNTKSYKPRNTLGPVNTN
jgi:hypothetical protein